MKNLFTTEFNKFGVWYSLPVEDKAILHFCFFPVFSVTAVTDFHLLCVLVY